MITRVIGTLLFVFTKDFWPIMFLITMIGPIVFVILVLSPLFLFINVCLVLAFIVYISNWFRLIRPWPAFRRFAFWEYLRNDYFKFRPYFNSEEEKALYLNTHPRSSSSSGQGVMWAFYPHGILSFTAMFNFVLNPVTEHIRACVHSGGFISPFFGLFLAWLNCIHVSRKSMMANLEAGNHIFLSPGGLVEAAYEGNHYKKRDGFLKIALETKSAVVPCWFPDERSYYKVWLPLGERTQPVLHYPFPMFVWGKWWLPILPRVPEKESRVLIGKKIDFGAPELADITIHDAQQLFYNEMDRLIAEADSGSFAKNFIQ